MSSSSTYTYPSDSNGSYTLYEKIRTEVEEEFEVEEGYIEYNVPTFYVRLQNDSKKAFLRVIKRLDPLGFTPTLRRRSGRVVLQALQKPIAKPSRLSINLIFLVASIGTMLLAGYYYSLDLLNAIIFMVSVFSIMVSHEMGHKFTADKHGVEASYPYFIPGPPPFGTFGAVIKQKSLAPNKDALFDLGASGPVSGFVITFVLAVIGIQMSQIHIVTELPPATLQTPLLLDFLVAVLLNPPAVPPGTSLLIQPSPVGYAAWIGALITMLQLFPTGTLDGGHVVRSLLGERGRGILSFVAIIAMAVLGYYIMAIIVLLLSMGRHPGPLDDVSGLSKGRRLASIGLVIIFIVVLTPISL